MLSKILDCPSCSFRFKYDYTETLPENITCPSCGETARALDYAALIFCPECRTKLKIPMTILDDPDNVCPQCGNPLKADTIFNEEDFASTFAGNEPVDRQLYKRLLQDGETFDKYRIIRLLGKGGMAEVYLAEHMLLRQRCALKLMRSGIESENPVYIKRFLREAKLLYQIEHPDIVKVFDVGSDFQSGYLFIAMEYIEGKTLHEKLYEKLLTEDELKNVLVTMAHALQTLYDAQVVHRDIKPSNIMLTAAGQLKLMDLGIAKFSGGREAGEMTLTMERSTIGTPNYASPEQCRSAHSADVRSDIYSLGATLYHLASGKLPFDGATPMETILQVMQQEPVQLKNYRPDLSRKMLNIIELMMKKNPDERPANPDQLLALIYGNKNPLSGGAIMQFNPLKWFQRKKAAGQLKKSVSIRGKVLKTVAVVGLLSLIGLNLKHVFDKLQHNKEIKAVQQTADQPIKVPEKRTVTPQKLARTQRGQELFAEMRRDPQNRLMFPEVVFDLQTATAEIADWKARRTDSKQWDKFVVKNNIMYPNDQARRDHSVQYLFLPAKLRGICHGITASLNMRIPAGENGCILRVRPDMELRCFGERLNIVFGDRYYTEIPWKFPREKWFNLTFICDRKNGKLAIFSGNLLIDEINTSPLKRRFFLGEIGFYLRSPRSVCRCEISDMVFYGNAVEYSLLPQQNRKYAVPFAADDPALLPAAALKNADNAKAKAAPAADIVKSQISHRDKNDRMQTGKNSGSHKVENGDKKLRFDVASWYKSSVNNGFLSDYPQAVQLSEQQKKPLLILFTPQNSDSGRSFLEYLKNSPDIQENLKRNFVVLHIEDAEDQSLAMPDEQRKHNRQQVLRFCMKETLVNPAVTFCNYNGRILYSRFNLSGAGFEKLLNEAENDSKKAAEYAAVEKRTVTVRLQEARFYRIMLRKLPASMRQQSFYVGAMQFINHQISVLHQQKSFQINARSPRNYSAVMTEKFRQKMQQYLADNSSVYSTNKRKQSDELLKMLQDYRVNPNITIKVEGKKVRTMYNMGGRTQVYAEVNVPLWELIACGEPFRVSRQKYLDILQNKNANVNITPVFKNLYWPLKICYMGKDDIDLKGDYHWGSYMVQRSLNLRESPIYKNNYDDLKKFLLLSPAVIGSADRLNQTILHKAAEIDDAELARTVMFMGLNNPYVEDKNGLTPWRTALLHGSRNVVELFKKYGYQTPETPEELRQYEFWHQIEQRNYTAMQQSLQAGIYPYAKNFNGMDILQKACLLNDITMTKLLLNSNIDFSRTLLNLSMMRDFQHPLQLAAWHGNVELFELLAQTSGNEMAKKKIRISMYNSSRLISGIIRLINQKISVDTAIDMFKILQKNDIWQRPADNSARRQYGMSYLHSALYSNIRAGDQKRLIEFFLQSGEDVTRLKPLLHRIIDQDYRQKLHEMILRK